MYDVLVDLLPMLSISYNCFQRGHIIVLDACMFMDAVAYICNAIESKGYKV